MPLASSSAKQQSVMDCNEAAWYQPQDEALQARIRVLACFTAKLQGHDWRCVLPDACQGVRDNPNMFDRIVDQILAPLLSKRLHRYLTIT